MCNFCKNIKLEQKVSDYSDEITKLKRANYYFKRKTNLLPSQILDLKKRLANESSHEKAISLLEKCKSEVPTVIFNYLGKHCREESVRVREYPPRFANLHLLCSFAQLNLTGKQHD